MEDTYGYQTDFITLYSQTIDLGSTISVSTDFESYSTESISYTLSDSMINKVTNLTLNSYDLGDSGVTHIILEVDQTVFEDIGRGHHISCGSHLCSKFNKPIQYFILHPQSTLSQHETLTFPSIVTPPYAGSYEFRIRVYKDNAFVKHAKFDVTINPVPLAAPTYEFNQDIETELRLFPHTTQYFAVTFATVDDLPAGTAYIQIIFDNYFSLVSDYCSLNTTAVAADGRGIECEVWVTENKVLLQHMGAVAGGT